MSQENLEQELRAEILRLRKELFLSRLLLMLAEELIGAKMEMQQVSEEEMRRLVGDEKFQEMKQGGVGGVVIPSGEMAAKLAKVFNSDEELPEGIIKH